MLTGIIVIGHTQVRLTADHKWMDGHSTSCRNGLEQNELVTIPLVNEGVGVVAASRVVVGKSEEFVMIYVEGLHIVGSISLKRLKFDKVSSGPLEHSGLNRLLLFGVVIVFKGDESIAFYFKGQASMSTPGSDFLKFVKLVVLPLVNSRLYGPSTPIVTP